MSGTYGVADPTPDQIADLTRIVFALLRLQPTAQRDNLITSLANAIKDPELRRREAALLISGGRTILDQLTRKAAA